MKVDFSIISILCSRICHDLINPAGNLDFVIKIIQEDAKKIPSDNNIEAVEIAAKSAESLKNRLSFIRMALGSASLGNDASGFAEVKKLIQDLFIDKNTNVQWGEGSDTLISKYADNKNLKLLMNIFFVIFGIIHDKTRMIIYAKEIDNTLGLAISVEGDNIRLSDDNIMALKGQIDTSKLTARNIHSYYTYLLVNEINANLEVYSENNREFKIALKYK